MNNEERFSMCRRAQIRWNELQDEKAYKRWKILEGRIRDEGLMDEYEVWYKCHQDAAVFAWNRRMK